MKGVIRAINSRNGRVAIETDFGYTVVEVVSLDDVEVGAEVVGDLDSHGRAHVTVNGNMLSVDVEAIHATRSAALDLLK